MKILFSPQVNENKLEYTFENDVITATLNGVTDIFDFSGMPNGNANAITSTLDTNPIISAKRVNNILYVELLNFIGEDATYEERFPEWFDSEAQNKPLESFLGSDGETPIEIENVPPEPHKAVESDSEGGKVHG